MLKDALRCEDGAVFYGRIDVEGEIFQASCYAELDRFGSLIREQPLHRDCRSEREAHDWFRAEGEARCFDRVYLEGFG